MSSIRHYDGEEFELCELMLEDVDREVGSVKDSVPLEGRRLVGSVITCI